MLLLGTTGAGKTYQLRGLIEQLRRADRRVGAIDKLGNHWGLTVSADGKSAGLDFVIFGGKRAHVPMEPSDGERLGQLFVEKNIPAIFDVSQWKADEQLEWIEAFADAVFLHNEDALHLAVDEAQSWVPQGGGGDAFNSVRRLAEQGRGNGIRLMLASQRWSRLDASVRGMADNLVVAMRQTSPIDRKAIAELVAISRTQQKDIEEQLPLLKSGEGYVWEPRSAELKRYRFPPNATFDSSRTPRHGDKPVQTISTSGGLVEELKALLAPPAAKEAPTPALPVPASDARRIAELEEELARERLRTQHARDEIEIAVDGAHRAIDRLKREVTDAFETYFPVGDANAQPHDANSQPAIPPEAKGAAAIVATTGLDPHPSPAAAPGPSPRPDVGEPHPLAERIIAKLTAIAPARLTWRQLASLLCYKPDGGYFRAGKRAALQAGAIREDGDYVAAIGVAGDPLTRDQAVELWRGVLQDPAPRLIEVLDRFPFMTKAELASELSYTATGGFFRKGLALLRQNGVTVESGDTVRLADPLPGQASLPTTKRAEP